MQKLSSLTDLTLSLQPFIYDEGALARGLARSSLPFTRRISCRRPESSRVYRRHRRLTPLVSALGLHFSLNVLGIEIFPTLLEEDIYTSLSKSLSLLSTLEPIRRFYVS